jgi:hypothetical protein
MFWQLGIVTFLGFSYETLRSSSLALVACSGDLLSFLKVFAFGEIGGSITSTTFGLFLIKKSISLV